MISSLGLQRNLGVGAEREVRALNEEYICKRDQWRSSLSILDIQTASTPIETQKPLVKDEEANDVDVHLYRSMIGSLMYLTASRPDIMFAETHYLAMQKQTIVATSTTEAEYVVAASCCFQDQAKEIQTEGSDHKAQEDKLNLLMSYLKDITVDHMDTKNAQDEGRTREIVDEDKEIEDNVISTEDVLSTDKEVKKLNTDIEQSSTADQRKVKKKSGGKKRIETPDEEKEVDYEILDKKYPTKEWKTESLGTKPQTDQAEHLEEINLNVVIRSNGQRDTLICKERCLKVLTQYFGELLMGFVHPDDKDEFWGSQQDWKIVSWKLHSSSGVHTLVTKEGVVIHMLVEKKYPLRKEVLMQMLKLKLESEEDSTMALELIKFIKKLLAELEPEEKG
ncbi:hypothetical protein Tco_0175312 [Tanacetum coccineum]